MYIGIFTTVIKDSFKKAGLVRDIPKRHYKYITYCIIFVAFLFLFFVIKMIYAITISLLIPLRKTISDLYLVTYFKHLHIVSVAF